jgi:hypothetical protein
MEKNWYKSKTLWGFGLLIISVAATRLGWLGEGTILELLRVAFGLLGVYGLRKALP